MEFTASKSKNKKSQPLPPKRGQIKAKIIGKFLKSTATIVSMARRGQSGLEESSVPSTPPEILSGYSSDGPSDGS
ncbi:hypothetical protein LguiA_012179 [Lonicera macranthoides]